MTNVNFIFHSIPGAPWATKIPNPHNTLAFFQLLIFCHYLKSLILLLCNIIITVINRVQVRSENWQYLTQICPKIYQKRIVVALNFRTSLTRNSSKMCFWCSWEIYFVTGSGYCKKVPRVSSAAVQQVVRKLWLVFGHARAMQPCGFSPHPPRLPAQPHTVTDLASFRQSRLLIRPHRSSY